MNDFDWKSLEKEYKFLFKNSVYSKMNRELVRVFRCSEDSEKLLILVSAYEKLERLIQK